MYGIVSLVVRTIREAKEVNLKLEHAPRLWKKPHTHVYGLLEYDNRTKYKLNEAKVFLARIANWEINDKLLN